MKIELKKIDQSNHEVVIVRTDQSTEKSILDTKTYLLHDICHFYVEQELKTMDGFWGMLAQGYRMEQLSGKTNQLTEKLRVIESIVGGTQSVFSNHMNETDFWNYLKSTEFGLTDSRFLVKVVTRIAKFMDEWKYLPIGKTIILNF
ncbi:MAG TPA: hypothetical protein PLY70_05255 [Saprospiraceae bacterium]|nr:hypothetical protein [Saprospiraceae bacterium]